VSRNTPFKRDEDRFGIEMVLRGNLPGRDRPAPICKPRQIAFGVIAFSVICQEVRCDGRNRSCTLRFIAMITLPLTKRIVPRPGVFRFVQSRHNVLLPRVALNVREVFTSPLALMQYRGEWVTWWNRTQAFVTLSLMPAVVFFPAARKEIVAGLTGGAMKGRTS
jgi:ABC-type glycerol-3-phosphate transport system permease component